VRTFSRDRLREELELFGRHKVGDLFLCDANFGLLASDEEFVEDFIRVRERYGFPRRLEPSWAKNKSKTFYRILHRMQEEGLRTSVTMALQSLDTQTLRLARRSNMKLNVWEDLIEWLVKEGLECYAELIWGLPGETFDSFLAGYDRLAERFSRIATYSVIVIPNTDLANRSEEHELVMVRAGDDDFGHVLSHATMSLEDNQRMHRFLFWARTLAEHMYFRHMWRPLRLLGGLRQSEVLLAMDRWIEGRQDPTSLALKRCRQLVVDHLDTSRIGDGLRTLYGDPGIDRFLATWWEEAIIPRLPEEHRSFLSQVFEYDLLTRPICDPGASSSLELVTLFDEDYYVREEIELHHDIPAALVQLTRGEDLDLSSKPIRLTLYYRAGFSKNIDSHEVINRYVGMTLPQLQAALQPSAASARQRRSAGPTLQLA
jgi:hypothetical protein